MSAPLGGSSREGPQEEREPQGSLSLAVHGAGRAARAQSKGCFQAEIVPVTTTVHDDEGTERSITVAQDEGIRPNTTMEGLAKLKPAFKKGGSTTAGETGLWGRVFSTGSLEATRQGGHERGLDLFSPALTPPYPYDLPLGNSSQVSDGAAAILLARRSKAEELGLPILGVLRSYAVVGVPPDIMGIGPAFAIPVALQKAGKTAPSHPRSGLHSCLMLLLAGIGGQLLGVVLWVLPSEGGAG